MKFIKIVLLLLISQSFFAQSAWTKNKNEGYLQLSFNAIQEYDLLFNKDGEDLKVDRKITDYTIQLYGEYGISNKTTLVVAIPVKLLKTGDAVVTNPSIKEGNVTEIGNIVLGVRQLLYQKNFQVSGQLNVDLNTSSIDEDTGLSSGFDSWAITPTISIGKSWSNYYAQAFTGIALQTNDFSNYFKIGGEFGYKFFDRLWVIGNVDIYDSLEDGDVVQTPLTNYSSGLYINDQQYTAFSLKFIGEINSKLGLTFSSSGAFNGHLVAKSPSINIGGYYKF